LLIHPTHLFIEVYDAVLIHPTHLFIEVYDAVLIHPTHLFDGFIFDYCVKYEYFLYVKSRSSDLRGNENKKLIHFNMLPSLEWWNTMIFIFHPTIGNRKS
jgi:hypothetical protein